MTYCEDCDHVWPESRKRQGYYWLCMEHKNLQGMGYVSKTEWVKEEPYLRCKDVNGGACKLFKALRNGQADNGL